MLCSSLRTARSANLVCSLERFFKPEQTTTRRNGAFRERVAWGRRQGGHDRADVPRAYVPRLLVTAALFRLLARALLRLFGAISLAVAKVVIVESGADYFFFRILAAARLGLRRLAPALTSGVDFTILFAAFAVLLDIEPGAEDMAAALTRLVAEAQTTPIFVLAIFFSAVAVVRGIVPGAYDVVFRKGATVPEAAGSAGDRRER